MNRTQLEIALAKRGIHTTTDFADKVGITRQTLTPIRHGIREATQEVAEQIRRTLELSDNEYRNIFPMQAKITKAREQYMKGE